MTDLMLNDDQAIYQHIKRQLNIYIARSGHSQSEIARRVKVSRATVTNWLRTGKISKGNLVKLCHELGISEQEILSADLRDFDNSPVVLTELQKKIIHKVQSLPAKSHYILESVDKLLS